MKKEEQELRDNLTAPLDNARASWHSGARVKISSRQSDNGELTADVLSSPRTLPGQFRTQRHVRRKERGVFQKVPGKNSPWWIRYVDAQGRFRREKAGTKSAAIDLYRKRKNDALEGKKLPEKLRRATVTFAEIAKDALAYSKANKLSYSDDVSRMETLLLWFREYPAEGITAQDIERRFEQQTWKPATMNRQRALLSLTYRLAIRNGKVKENPARQVQHRLENNARIRFLSPEEETTLRTVVEAAYPERISELDLALHTGMRVSEQYQLRWEDVSFTRRTLTIARSKNGETRHVPLNKAALAALVALEKRVNGSEFVCGGANEPRRWFEPAVKATNLTAFSWHCLRHTFASRLVMAGVDIRTVQELLGHKTIQMTVRYSHLAPKHTLAAVERLDPTTKQPTDTTTDTSAFQQPSADAAVLH
jgi:site-specific recombinase XerD